MNEKRMQLAQLLKVRRNRRERAEKDVQEKDLLLASARRLLNERTEILTFTQRERQKHLHAIAMSANNGCDIHTLQQMDGLRLQFDVEIALAQRSLSEAEKGCQQAESALHKAQKERNALFLKERAIEDQYERLKKEEKHNSLKKQEKLSEELVKPVLSLNNGNMEFL